MHPDMLRALAKARHDDLLNTHPARGQLRIRLAGHRSPVLAQWRHRVGSMLIRAGARLVEEAPAELDLAPQRS